MSPDIRKWPSVCVADGTTARVCRPARRSHRIRTGGCNRSQTHRRSPISYVRLPPSGLRDHPTTDVEPGASPVRGQAKRDSAGAGPPRVRTPYNPWLPAFDPSLGRPWSSGMSRRMSVNSIRALTYRKPPRCSKTLTFSPFPVRLGRSREVRTSRHLVYLRCQWTESCNTEKLSSRAEHL